MRDYETMRSLLTFISFWSSADLTGNQTNANSEKIAELFWSSADLTGNQTLEDLLGLKASFGAVPI